MNTAPGIYKITSPTGRIYIGQTINIKKRFQDYRYFKCKSQFLLAKSIKKYGLDNHRFEVLEYCNIGALHGREVFYIDFYRSNKNRYQDGLGMNLTDGGQGSRGYRHTEEVRKKMSVRQSSKKQSAESNLKRSLTQKGRPIHPNLFKGIIKKQSEEHKRKRLAAHLMPVINTNTGIVYPSIKHAAIALGYRPPTLAGWLRGDYENKSPLIYYPK